MGSRAKFSDREKRCFQRRPRAGVRAFQTRSTLQRFLIVCEGEETEPNYFRAIGGTLPTHLVDVEVVGEGANTLSLVRRAQDLRDQRAKGDYPFDQVWVVFDRDSFDRDSFDNAVHMGEADGIGCAWSNEAFELWYILHFEDRQTGMRRTEYKKKLSKYLGVRYRKNATDMYGQLAAKGAPVVAARRAERLEENRIGDGTTPSLANPCTTVYKLVDELRKFDVQPKAN